jgi:hypothetical protein
MGVDNCLVSGGTAAAPTLDASGLAALVVLLVAVGALGLRRHVRRA